MLCGISWGGKLAAAVARHQPGLFDGLVLITPGLYSSFEPNPVQRLAMRIPVRQRMQRRQFEIPIQRGSLYTETPRWRDYIDSDPLSLREVTYRFAQADNRLARYAKEGAPYIHTPTLMMLSGRDRIVTNSRCRAFLGRHRLGAQDARRVSERGPHARIRVRPRPLLRGPRRLDRADGGDVADDSANLVRQAIASSGATGALAHTGETRLAAQPYSPGLSAS